ncbi:kinase-like domain-containing protein [Mycena vulgaris]|nr:kinase-like domain-containing protein [Mycena vulgaris]
MAKLGSVDSLVYALQYKETLIKTSSDLGVAGHSKLKVALEADQAALGDHVVEVLYSPADERVVLALEDNAAQSLLDIIQHTLDDALLHTRDATSKARRLIGKLAKACDKIPSSLELPSETNTRRFAAASGMCKPVALKHMRMFQGTDQRDIRRKFCREALVWQRLRNPYIVPLIGIDTESFPSSLSMVSPWMKNGTVIKYLSGIPDSDRQGIVNRLIREIAQGLAFLHDQRVSNILVDDNGSACLTDFGLTVLSDATATQTNHGAGSVRWMAPETLNPSACGLTEFARTPASDIYAFACLYTGYPPVHDAILHDAPVMLQVINGERPSRPPNLIPDQIWQLTEQCWAHNFDQRPSILSIVLELAMHERLSAEVALNSDSTISADLDDGTASDQEEIYGGWVDSVVAPIAEFIDTSVDPRHHYVDLREMADGPGGTTLYVARVVSAHHELLMLPDAVRYRDEDDLTAEGTTFVAIKSIPMVPGGSSKLAEVLRELRSLFCVHCENILGMDALYVDPVEDALWIRMELMTRSLSSVIELNGVGLVLSDRMIAGCAKDAMTQVRWVLWCGSWPLGDVHHFKIGKRTASGPAVRHCVSYACVPRIYSNVLQPGGDTVRISPTHREHVHPRGVRAGDAGSVVGTVYSVRGKTSGAASAVDE